MHSRIFVCKVINKIWHINCRAMNNSHNTVSNTFWVFTIYKEVGDYFPEFLDMVEKNAFLKAVMPWGERSIAAGMQRNFSNDGPILWSRPGEQMVPTADMPKSPFKRKR
jgi:hypothetical protein